MADKSRRSRFTGRWTQPPTDKPRQHFGYTLNGEPLTELAGITYFQSLTNPTREQALRIPVIAAARNSIVSSIVGLPLRQVDEKGNVVTRPFLRNPDPSRTRSAFLKDVIDDLLFDGRSHLGVDKRTGAEVVACSHLGNKSVEWDANKGVWRVNGQERPANSVIQIEGVHGGILGGAAQRVITDATLLGEAASALSAAPMPHGYFQAAEGSDPNQEDVAAFLRDWETARRRGAYAWVPDFLKFIVPQRDLHGMQLDGAKEQLAREGARATSVLPESVAVSTTSRTYANIESQRQDTITITLGQYTRPIEERLSMPDVTRPNHEVRFDFAGFLRADTNTRFQTYAIALGGEPFLTVNEVREREGLQPIAGGDVLPKKTPAVAAVPDSKDSNNK